MAGISFKQRGDPPSSTHANGATNSTTNGKSVSISFSSKKPSTTPSSSKKRPLSSLIDDDEPHEHEPTEKIETVSGFASGKVITGREAPVKKELVIQGSRNKDWREESRKRKRGNLLPAEEQARREAERTGKVDGNVNVKEEGKEEEVTYGLILQDKSKRVNEMDVDVKVEEEKPKTADEEALSALLSDQKKSSTLILPSGTNVTNDRFTARAREDAAFLSDVASRPDAASLEEYAAVPIEEFGAALLRGMGWKEGQSVGRRRGANAGSSQIQPVVPKVAAPPRRGGVLGIGAKEVPGEVVDEIGAWGKGARDKRKVVGVPMVMRNKVTGEMISEEELRRRTEGEGLVLDEGRDEGRREKHRDRERERDERDRGKERDRERERNGHRRDKDKERRRDERDSKRDRERDRERERDRDKNRDRERSHEHRRRDEKRRDRDRDRDRDEDRHRRR